MKKLKFSMLAVLFTVGIGTAVVQKIHAAPKPQDPSYNWTTYDTSGHVTGTLSNETVSEARNSTGCEGITSTKCAVASGVGAPTIFYN